jgi:hypothetical protein
VTTVWYRRPGADRRKLGPGPPFPFGEDEVLNSNARKRSTMQVSTTLAGAVLVAALGWAEANAAPCRPMPPVPAFLLSARYLGSEGYYQAHGGNARDFVKALFTDVLRRSPTESELQRWTARSRACGDGVSLASEFLIFAQSELASRAPPPVLVWPNQPRYSGPCRPCP